MTIRAVVFDRDRTLLFFDRQAVARLERQVSERAPQIPPGAASAHWLGWPGPWPRAVDEEPAFWSAFWRALAARHGLDAAAARRLEDIGDFYHTCFVAFEDAAGCIGELRALGLRLAILTNFELPSIDRTLRHAGLDPASFDVLASSAAIGAQKPDARAYHAVTGALGLPPQSCLMVDDLPANIAGARAAGLAALLLDREGAYPDERERLTDLLALPGRIGRA